MGGVNFNRQRGVEVNQQASTGKLVVWGLVALAVVLVLTIGGCAGAKSFSRYQKQADARNQVKITHILIQRAKQQAQINYAQIQATKAEAQKRIVEAEGIRRAQDLISKTLTPLYVQHEAIQAQKLTANGDRTIYIPIGPQGVPLVADVNGDRVGQ